MPQDRVKAYFLGSGQFAVPVLEALAGSDEVEFAGAGTQPDRPAGRNRALTPTPVGKRAEELGIPCERVASVNAPEFLGRMAAVKPDLLVVVSFGQLLKEGVLSLPPLGCLNVHASLLPEHRGASPIAAAILAGDSKTGVSFMRMDKGLDTGPVYCSLELPLQGTETRCGLESELSKLAASGIVSVVKRIAAGGLSPVEQDPGRASLSKKIRKQDGSLDWSEEASAIHRKIRAYQPWPGTSFLMNSQTRRLAVKVVEASVVDGAEGRPGETLSAGGRDWVVACGKGALRISKVVPEGKREMPASDFLRGARVSAGDVMLNGPNI